MLALPFGLSVLAWLTGMGAFLQVQHDWRSQVATQLAIDRCAARASLALRDLLTGVDASNARIRALRASLLATAAPPLQAALRTALGLESARQELLLAKWRIQGARWLLPGSCRPPGRGWVHAEPLPSAPWTRVLPDGLGPRPSAWSSPQPERHVEFRVALNASGRSTHAFVRKHDRARWGATWRPKWLNARPGLD